MTAKQLINFLNQMEQNLDVKFIDYDGYIVDIGQPKITEIENEEHYPFKCILLAEE